MAPVARFIVDLPSDLLDKIERAIPGNDYVVAPSVDAEAPVSENEATVRVSLPWWWRIALYAFLARAWLWGATDEHAEALADLIARNVKVAPVYR